MASPLSSTAIKFIHHSGTGGSHTLPSTINSGDHILYFLGAGSSRGTRNSPGSDFTLVTATQSNRHIVYYKKASLSDRGRVISRDSQHFGMIAVIDKSYQIRPGFYTGISPDFTAPSPFYAIGNTASVTPSKLSGGGFYIAHSRSAISSSDSKFTLHFRGSSWDNYYGYGGIYSPNEQPSGVNLGNSNGSLFMFEGTETNKAPTTPGVFTVQPEPLSVNLAGETVSVEWGASTDADGDTVKYDLEFYNGSSYITIASDLTSRSYNYTLPSVDVNIALFRVRAVDSNGAMSSYRTSNNFQVRKYLLLIQDGQELKTFKDGNWQIV
jgi:hypothetical protein